MGIPTSGRDTSQNGPSWYDVYAMQASIEKQYGTRVLIDVRPSGKGSATWGYIITASVEGKPSNFGCGSFGPAHPGNGQKTIAAATYHALYRLDERIARGWLDEIEVIEQLPLV